MLFEATATSTMESLYVRCREPLLAAILRRIMRDEARHLAFSYVIAGTLGHRYTPSQYRSMEDIMFEAVVACLSTFLAEPVWHEMGFPREVARRCALDQMVARGVIASYARVVPRQLAQRGFPSDRLAKLLREDLVPRLMEGEVVA